ncbi:MAG: hypothetical protein DRQ51_10255 [Gammaproteobacteria bacterium]|nr:MAG: hypothetical protein DRQ51_10255 [Gammaproteobacteria bacterium]
MARILFGLVVFIISFPLLFWNEGRAVKTYQSLSEGADIVINVTADKIDKNNNLKLIHLTDKADTREFLTDKSFAITENAIRLYRQVKTYQWQEQEGSMTEKKPDGKELVTKTYTYNKIWSEELINSTNFNQAQDYKNPKIVNFYSQTLRAKKVTVGAFELSHELKNKISTALSIVLSMDKIPQELKNNTTIHDNCFLIKKNVTNFNKQQLNIGDQCISFKVIKPNNISIIAQQINNTFAPFTTTNGKTISILKMGTFSAKSMFEDAENSNLMLSWLLRIAGFVLMMLGITLIIGPLSKMANSIPFIGVVIEFGLIIASSIIALFFSITTISIAWLGYRPLLSVSIVVLSILVFTILYFIKKRKIAAIADK